MNKIYEIDETDENYPQNLLKLKNHPKKLYVMGDIKILNNKSVAMVGSRDNTSYGKYYASNFAKTLSKAGITVVSGLALGIDAICHLNSMKEKGKTIAVIGSGFNNMYPPENIELAKQIVENGGAIISEYPPEKQVNLSNFPIRNRIIAGLASLTIVVEAKYRSGSGITARHTLKQGKSVFCIPGRIGDKTGKGTNNLIKKGAILLTDINQIFTKLGEHFINNKSNLECEELYPKIEKQYEDIYYLIKKDQMNVNEIARKLNINISELNVKLTMMELEGIIEVLPGNIVKIKEY